MDPVCMQSYLYVCVYVCVLIGGVKVCEWAEVQNS